MEKQDDNQDPFADKFSGLIDFAGVGDQNTVQYAPVWDFDGNIIYLPFIDPNQPVSTLIDAYCQQNSSKQEFKQSDKIFFMHKYQGSTTKNKKGSVGSIGQWLKFFANKEMKIVSEDQVFEQQFAVTNLHITLPYYQENYKEDKKGVKLTIKVRSLFDQHINAGQQKIFQLKVRDTDPIGHIKHMIKKLTGVTCQKQRLIYGGVILNDHETLEGKDMSQGNMLILFQEMIVSLQDFKITVKKYQGDFVEVNKMEEKEGQLIQNIFQYVTNYFQIKKKQDYKISFNGKSLDRQKRLSDYAITNGSILYLLPSSIQSLEYDGNKDNALIILKVSRTQYFDLIYGVIKGLTVLELLSITYTDYKNKKQCDKFWCIQYGDRILLPDQKINILDMQIKPGMTIQVLKNQKYFFYSKLKDEQAFNSKLLQELPQSQINLVKKTSKTIPDRIKENIQNKIFRQTDQTVFMKEEFHSSIQCYTCNTYYRQINAFLRENNVQKKEYIHHKFFKFSNSLISSISKLPNHFGQVFRGIKNFKFIETSKFKPRQLICFKSFTSTSTDKDKAEKTFCNSKGTMFYITSITGKPISAFSVLQKQYQVLFPPFTYFVIDKIELKPDCYEKIWLTEVPSPTSYKKDTILWVDDLPKNNLQLLSKIQNQNNQMLQILQVTSTLAANLWMQQFNKMLQFKGVQLKVISDMVRYQKKYAEGKQDKVVPNYEAGIDLLIDFNSKHKYTTKIIIFCGDTKRAQQNTLKIENINIKDKIWKVTSSPKEVLDFCNFKPGS